MAWNYEPGNKYHAHRIEEGGETFDSRKEYLRWVELNMMQRAGEITNLRRQVKFVLIPAQREPDKVGPKGGTRKGKLLERECSYIADYVYTDAWTGETVVEDTKGMKTEVYKIKRKLMLFRHGIQIREV